MKLALVQQKAGPDREENVERGLSALERAAEAGARLVCFAELAFEPFYPQRPAEPGFESLAEPVPGPVTERFCAAARRLGKTRMVHITEYDCFHEQGYYAPGDTGTPVFDTAAGSIGVAICYDRHYPEYMRALALRGAEIVVVPQAGAVGEWPDGLYEAEMRVAAFQNGYHVALCNRVGREERLEFAGESFVCDPRGVVTARAGSATEELLYVDVDLDANRDSHGRRLFLRDRRPELYAGWLAPDAR